MARHPITLLAPAASCAVVAGFWIALAVSASLRDADTFVMFGGIGAIGFGWRACIEARRAWPKFRAALAHLSALRRSVPLTRINLPKEDVQ